MKIRYIKELDGIRGGAALMIMFFHFFQSLQSTHINALIINLQKISKFGQTGVTLFFVLSGFLITRILLVTKDSQNYFSSFYMRRSLRIFPLYYFFLLLSCFIIPFILKDNTLSWDKQWYYWVYLQNFAMTFKWDILGPRHLWSLAVEEHFYLFWPLLIYYLKPNQIKKAVYIIFAAAIIIRVILLIWGYGSFYFTFSNVDALAIGSLLALDEQNGLDRKFYGRLFIIMVIPTLVLWLFVGGTGNAFIQIIKLPLNAITYYGFIGFVVASNSRGIISKALVFKPLNFSGKISYGLYVYHPLVFSLYQRYVPSNNLLIDLLASFLLAYLVASLSFYLFEAKVLNLKKYFIYSPKV